MLERGGHRVVGKSDEVKSIESIKERVLPSGLCAGRDRDSNPNPNLFSTTLRPPIVLQLHQLHQEGRIIVLYRRRSRGSLQNASACRLLIV